MITKTDVLEIFAEYDVYINDSDAEAEAARASQYEDEGQDGIALVHCWAQQEANESICDGLAARRFEDAAYGRDYDD